MTHGIFITGTDTGIGKTYVSVSIVRAMNALGLRAVGMKPVASGCVQTAAGWRNDDALALQQVSCGLPDYALINPFALPLATAPEIAAADAGVHVELAPILAAFKRLAAGAEHVLVEGVGGWCAPLSPTLDQLDLVRALDLPVVLVVGLRLGCINHARLTAAALQISGVEVRGWIANAIDPQFEHADATLAILRERLATTRYLGTFPHAATGANTLPVDLAAVFTHDRP